LAAEKNLHFYNRQTAKKEYNINVKKFGKKFLYFNPERDF